MNAPFNDNSDYRAPCDEARLADLHAVLRRVVLGREPSDIAARCATVREALDRLAAAGFLSEAATLMAHALPRREAVWWACVCARLTAPDRLSEDDRQAVAAARSWVCCPRREACQAAMIHAERAGLATPEAWAAVAAFWSDESVSTAGDDVPHPAYLTGVAVAGAIGLAAVRDAPERRDERLTQFLANARHLNLGDDRCQAA